MLFTLILLAILPTFRHNRGMKCAAQVPVVRLRRRTDFVRMTHQAHKMFTPGFVLQYQQRPGEPCVQIGLTATKKLGGAVVRNRAKRRLRGLTDRLMRLNPAFHSAVAYDMVLVARSGLLQRAYQDLRQDFAKCLEGMGCRYSDAS